MVETIVFVCVSYWAVGALIIFLLTLAGPDNPELAKARRSIRELEEDIGDNVFVDLVLFVAYALYMIGWPVIILRQIITRGSR